MKLRSESLDVNEQLLEFDQWLTPKLERIKDTEKFQTEINSVIQVIENVAPFVDNFETYDNFGIDKICDGIIEASGHFIEGSAFVEDEANVTDFYISFFNLLFLASGATDNNLKNHFLIKLKNDDIESKIPKRTGVKKNIKFKLNEIPSTVKSDAIAKMLAACFVGQRKEYSTQVKTEPLFSLEIYLKLMLTQYVSLILEDQEELLQLWSICKSYFTLKDTSEDVNFGRYLLNSCTIFKVRGSVSASGGHIPEDLLRTKLTNIGLEANTDFNIADVIIGEQEIVEGKKRKKKTRAYDFILPFNITDWEPKPKLFIQSQFYAGDSGSVSHKVVDQTLSSRQFTKEKYPNARFVEYLDGAGYYAALRGDLEHMLSYDSTSSFFQVKTALVRLRREFQEIYYLTPVEFEQQILTTSDGELDNIYTALAAEGYPISEIDRVKALLLLNATIVINENRVEIAEGRKNIARRFLILDIAANHGRSITKAEKNTEKYILVPGYGQNYGILESDLSLLVCDIVKIEVVTANQFTKDLEWLLDEGVIARK
jgi:hypothetical protein